MGYNTRVFGEGEIISEAKQITDQMGEPATNFLLRTKDKNILRIHMWNTDVSELLASLDTQSVKGCLISFRGVLRGVYDEKPNVVISIGGIFPPGGEEG